MGLLEACRFTIAVGLLEAIDDSRFPFCSVDQPIDKRNQETIVMGLARHKHVRRVVYRADSGRK